MLLGQQPVPETLEMNESYGAGTFTGHNQWIVLTMLAGPANAALNLVRICDQFGEIGMSFNV